MTLNDIGLWHKPLRTVWLSTLKLNIDGLQINLDCYGTSEEKLLVVACKSYNQVTEILEAWSY